MSFRLRASRLGRANLTAPEAPGRHRLSSLPYFTSLNLHLRSTWGGGHHLVEVTVLVEEELGRAFFDDLSLPNGYHPIHFREYRPRAATPAGRVLRLNPLTL